jgi:hypothetical protein
VVVELRGAGLRAGLHPDRDADAVCWGAFVVVSRGTRFSWYTRDCQHSVDDVPGAAKKLVEFLKQQAVFRQIGL